MVEDIKTIEKEVNILNDLFGLIQKYDNSTYEIISNILIYLYQVIKFEDYETLKEMSENIQNLLEDKFREEIE